MADELLVIIARKTSFGAQLEFDCQFFQTSLVLATMLVIYILGMVVEMHTKRGLLLG
jgi:hypothetical protein